MSSEIEAHGFCESDCKRPVYTKEQTLALLQAAIDNGSLASCTGNVIVSQVQETKANAVLKFWVGTEAEYNAVTNKDPNTYYIKTDDTTIADLSAAVAALQADGSITTAKLANGAITAAKLADGAVTATKLASGATTPADGSITTAKLADGAVTAEKIASGAIPSGVTHTTFKGEQIVFQDGDGNKIRVTPTLHRYSTGDNDGGIVIATFKINAIPENFNIETVVNDEIVITSDRKYAPSVSYFDLAFNTQVNTSRMEIIFNINKTTSGVTLLLEYAYNDGVSKQPIILQTTYCGSVS